MSHPLYTISRNLGTIAVLIGHLLKGLFVAFGRKAKTDGIPKSIQLARWAKNQTMLLVRRLKEACRSKVMEAGQISKLLLIFIAQNLTTRGVLTILRNAQSLKSLSILFYGKAKIVVKDKIYVIKQDMASEQAKASESASIPSSSDIVLKNEETASPNERLAQEIIQNGIECKAMTNTGSLAIIKNPYYSYLFAMSPRIITNRGCIRLSEGNNTRNIDFIQIVQKN